MECVTSGPLSRSSYGEVRSGCGLLARGRKWVVPRKRTMSFRPIFGVKALFVAEERARKKWRKGPLDHTDKRRCQYVAMKGKKSPDKAAPGIERGSPG